MAKLLACIFRARTYPHLSSTFRTPFRQTIFSAFSENSSFESLTRFCSIRSGVPPVSNPSLQSFCTQYANDFAKPANPVFPFDQWTVAREGWEGGSVRRVDLCLNTDFTDKAPPTILFNPLHCYEKFIHAAGNHHWSRQNIRLIRTLRPWPMLMSTALYFAQLCCIKFSVLQNDEMYESK